MVRKVMFHIGSPKTATTYLQKYIWAQLKKEDWLVIDPFFNNTDLYKKFMKDITYFNQPQFMNQNVLVSIEYLSDPFRPYVYNYAMLELLKQEYSDAEFLIFKRSYNDHINSLYLQTIKTGSAISPSRFLKDRKILNLDVDNLNKLSDECDYVFNFEDLRKNTINLFRSLNVIFKFDFKYIDKKETNTSFGIISAPISRFLNHFFRSMNNPHGLIPLPRRHTHLFTLLRRYKWYRKLDKKIRYFE